MNGIPAFLQAYPSAMYGGAPPANMSSSEQRAATTKAAILSTLPVSGFKGFTLSVVPTIVAWTDQPFQDITVNGAHPRSFAETGVVLTAPVEEISEGSLPAGVVAGHLADIEGDAQPGAGPPGVVVLQAGSVIYDFAPNLKSGSRLSGVAIVSSNFFGGKVGPAGAEGAPLVSAQVWDWGSSKWIDVTYADSGSTVVPAAGVNPSTGEVQMKLSSKGAFSSGWLSLTGDVR